MARLDDRFTLGVISALIASIPALIYNLSTHHFFNVLRFLDFGSYLIFGHLPKNFLEVVFALFGTIMFKVGLGIIFAFIIGNISSKNIILKGWVFSVLIWFSTYSITFLFKVPGLLDIPLKTVASNLIASSIWGTALAYTYVQLERSILNETEIK